MARELKTGVLDSAAEHYASEFVKADRRDWVMGQFYQFGLKDEFEYLVGAVAKLLGGNVKKDFNDRVAALEPRTDKVFQAELAKVAEREAERQARARGLN